MFARVTTLQVRLDTVDQATSMYRDSVVPAAKAQKGYRAAYLLTDAASGKSISVTVWDTVEDLQANEASGFFQEQVAKFAAFMTSQPVREIYKVDVQDQA